MDRTERIQVSESAGSALVIEGDAYDLIARLEQTSIDLLLTSPPYWGLRDYEQEHNWEILRDWKAAGHPQEEPPPYEWYRDHGGLLGLEPLPEWYVSNIVSILHRAWDALTPAGSMWLNVGDTYFARWSSIRPKGRQGLNGPGRLRRKTPMGGVRQEKNLLLIPSRVAIGLQERRWILRNDLIWYKPNVPPKPFTDRLSLTHEHLFHFVKRPTEGRAKYYYQLKEAGDPTHDVQTVLVAAGRDSHSATFPTKLIRPRIRSSCPPGGVVLDPFCGTGTALVVAIQEGRRAVGFDNNPRFVKSARKAVKEVTPTLFP